METFKQPWVTYICAGIALIAVVCSVFWPQYSSIAWAVASIGGFAGVASLRAFINSSGYKTYIIAALNVIPALLLAFNVLDTAAFAAITAALATLTGMTLQAAQSKAKNGI